MLTLLFLFSQLNHLGYWFQWRTTSYDIKPLYFRSLWEQNHQQHIFFTQTMLKLLDAGFSILDCTQHNLLCQLLIDYFKFVWKAVTALSQLNLFVYSYLFYDNANLPYAVTWWFPCIDDGSHLPPTQITQERRKKAEFPMKTWASSSHFKYICLCYFKKLSLSITWSNHNDRFE